MQQIDNMNIASCMSNAIEVNLEGWVKSKGLSIKEILDRKKMTDEKLKNGRAI